MRPSLERKKLVSREISDRIILRRKKKDYVLSQKQQIRNRMFSSVTVESVEELVRRTVRTSIPKAKRLRSTPEVAEASIPLDYAVVTPLSAPQKFRMRLRITDNLLETFQKNECLDAKIRSKLGKIIDIVSNDASCTPEEHLTRMYIAMFSYCIFQALKAKKCLLEETPEEFMKSKIRQYEIHSLGQEDSTEVEILLNGFIWANIEGVKIFLGEVIDTFVKTDGPLHHAHWLRERVLDLVVTDIYEQDTPLYLPYEASRRSLLPENTFYINNNFSSVDIDTQYLMNDLDRLARVVEESLWSIQRKDIDKTHIMNQEGVSTPLHLTFKRYYWKQHLVGGIRPLKVNEPLMESEAKKEIISLLMKAYEVESPADMPLFITKGKGEFWGLSKGDTVACPCLVCNGDHDKNRFALLKSSGRVLVGCMEMKKGERCRYIGMIDTLKPHTTAAKRKPMLEALLGEKLKIPQNDLPFDLSTSNNGDSWFLNTLRPWRCPLCHERCGNNRKVSVALDTMKVFFRCDGPKEKKQKEFLDLGSLYTPEERRRVAVSDETAIKNFILHGTPFEEDMRSEKKSLFETIYKDESARIKRSILKSRYLARLGRLRRKGANIIQSPCGSAKTYQSAWSIMELSMKMKLVYHVMTNEDRLEWKERKMGKEARDLARIRRKMDAFDRKTDLYLKSLIESGKYASFMPDDEMMDEMMDEIMEETNNESDNEKNNETENPSTPTPLTLSEEREAVDLLLREHKDLLDKLGSNDYIPMETLQAISDVLSLIYPEVYPSILWISTRISYARNMFLSYKHFIPHLVLYLDDKSGNMNQKQLLLSIESLRKSTHNEYFDVIVLDEIASIFEQFISPHLEQKAMTKDIFARLVRETDYLICMDANITSEVLYMISKLRAGDLAYIENRYKRKKGHTAIYYDDLKDLKLQIANHINANKRVHIVCTVRKQAHTLAEIFKDYNVLLVTSETNNNKTKKLLDDINESIKLYHVFIHTSTLSVGVDITTPWGDATFIIASPRTVNSNCVLQMKDRIRETKGTILHYHVMKLYSPKPSEFDFILRDLKEKTEGNNEIRMRITKEMDTAHYAGEEVFDLNDPWVISYLYRVQSENLKYTCLREMLDYRLEEEGYRMTRHTPSKDLEESHEEWQLLNYLEKEAKKQLSKEELEALGESTWFDFDDLDDDWEGRTKRTVEEKDRYSRALEEDFRALEREYRAGKISEADAWTLRKTKILMKLVPEVRKKIHRDGSKLLEMEKAYTLYKRSKRLEKGIDALVEQEMRRFEANPNLDGFLGDNNLKLAVNIYICQLLGLKSPMEEKEVLREGKTLSEAEKLGKSEEDIRIAEGGLDKCVAWITTNQSFIITIFGLNWVKPFNSMRSSLENRELQKLLDSGVGNRLSFDSRKRTKEGQIRIIRNTCNLNEISSYFV